MDPAKTSDTTATGGATPQRGTDRVRVALPMGGEPGLTEISTSPALGDRRFGAIPGTVHCHVDDPPGNRLELNEAGP